MKDLHIHTSYSDGEYNEFEILDMVLKSGLKEFAICDHDTLEGSRRVDELLKKGNYNLIFHSGVELTCRFNSFLNGINLHLLAYDFNYNNNEMLEIIKEISALRKEKINVMVNYVQDLYDIKIPQDKLIQSVKNTKSFGKPHLYSIMCEMGNFDREQYYKNMDKLNTAHLKLDAEKTILKLKGSAKMVLAHPVEIMKEHNLNIEQIEQLIIKLKDIGINGVETHHSGQTKELQEQLTNITKKYDLKESFGSDYHGPNVKPNLNIGDIQKII